MGDRNRCQLGEWPAERPRTVRLDAAIRGALHRLWQQSNDSQRQFIDTAMRQWASHPNAVAGRWAEPLRGLSFWNAPKAEPVPSIRWHDWLRLNSNCCSSSPVGSHSSGDGAPATRRVSTATRRPTARSCAAGATSEAGRCPASEGTDQLQANVGAEPVAWPDRKPIVSDAKPSFIEGDSLIPVPIRAERGSPFDRIEILCPVLPSGTSSLRWTESSAGLGPAAQQSRPGTGPCAAARLGLWTVCRAATWQRAVLHRQPEGPGNREADQDQRAVPVAPLSGSSMTKEPQLFVDTLGTEDNRMPPDYRPVSQYVGFSRPSTELFDPYDAAGPGGTGDRRNHLFSPAGNAGLSGERRPVRNCGGVTTCPQAFGVLAMNSGRSRSRRQPSGRPAEPSRWADIANGPSGSGRGVAAPLGATFADRPWTAPRGNAVDPRPAGTTPPATQPQPEPEDLPGGLEPPVVPTPELREAPSEPLHLSLVDLDGMKTVWSRTYPAGSAAFEVDEEWLGVLHAPERSNCWTSEPAN